jgi:hypothetical protein
MKSAADRYDEALNRAVKRSEMPTVGVTGKPDLDDAFLDRVREEVIAAIEAAGAEERARWQESHHRLLIVARSLAAELTDPGTEALAAIYCAEAIERGVAKHETWPPPCASS